MLQKEIIAMKSLKGINGPDGMGRNQSCCYPVFTCPYISCPCIHDAILSCDWVVGCLCLCSLFSLSNSVTSFLCAKERPCFKIGT